MGADKAEEETKEVDKLGDHYIQAKFLGQWSFTEEKDRDGTVYAQKLDDPSGRWFKVSIENILTETGGDKLTPVEVEQINIAATKQRANPTFQKDLSKYDHQMEIQRLIDLPSMPIDENSLEADLLHPIENNGYTALSEAVDDPSRIKHRLNFPYLAKWILLHQRRTPKGKRLLRESIRQATARVAGRQISQTEFKDFLQQNNCGNNYLLYLDYLNGGYNQAKSARLQRLYSRIWTVREISRPIDVICGDNPIVDVGTYPQSVLVPLGPRRVLFIHIPAPGIGTTPLIDSQVRSFNGIQRQNAERWLISNVENPVVPTPGQIADEERRLAFQTRTAGFIPRNAKCPCGSGRKFKNCCGRKSA